MVRANVKRQNCGGVGNGSDGSDGIGRFDRLPSIFHANRWFCGLDWIRCLVPLLLTPPLSGRMLTLIIDFSSYRFCCHDWDTAQ